MRPDDRRADDLRPVTLERRYTRYAEGAVLVSFGDTKVVCTATVEDAVPPFLRNSGTGWVTAEYAMLPRSSTTRIPRDASKRGRAQEISRLIGRSLRAVVDLDAMGERQVLLDCDVLQADGGTRTAAITGAYVALHDAFTLLCDRGDLAASPLLGLCSAVSVGLVENEPRLDLCYLEDVAADVDLNLVMRSDGNIIEIQGCAEGEPFAPEALTTLVHFGRRGCDRLFAIQREALGLG